MSKYHRGLVFLRHRPMLFQVLSWKPCSWL